VVLQTLEGTARYAGLLLAPAESFGLRPRIFLPFGQKKELIIQFWPIFGIFWSPVITLLTFSSNISINNNNNKKSKKFQKISKNPKIQKTSKKSKKIQKKSKKTQKIQKIFKNPLKKKPKKPKNCQKWSKNPKIRKKLKKSQKITFFLFFFCLNFFLLAKIKK
jgi:hypothetical protein